MLLNSFFTLSLVIVLLYTSCITDNSNSCDVELKNFYSTEIVSTYGVDNRACVKHLMDLRDFCRVCPCNTQEVGSNLLNLGSIYFEELQNVDSSLLFLNEARNFYIEKHDTMGYANILKYFGWILAENGNIEGIDSIFKARELYSFVGDNNGVAVCDRNLGISLYNFEKYALAKIYFTDALQHWVDVGSSSRIKLLYQDYVSTCASNKVHPCPLRSHRLDSLFSQLGYTVEVSY